MYILQNSCFWQAHNPRQTLSFSTCGSSPAFLFFLPSHISIQCHKSTKQNKLLNITTWLSLSHIEFVRRKFTAEVCKISIKMEFQKTLLTFVFDQHAEFHLSEPPVPFTKVHHLLAPLVNATSPNFWHFLISFRIESGNVHIYGNIYNNYKRLTVIFKATQVRKFRLKLLKSTQVLMLISTHFTALFEK